MKMIHKYPLEGFENAVILEVEMPQGSRILAVQVQRSERMLGPLANETVCLWAVSNTDESRMVRRMFRIYGMGREIFEPLEALDYIGTVQKGPFVWHVFERKGASHG